MENINNDDYLDSLKKLQSLLKHRTEIEERNTILKKTMIKEIQNELESVVQNKLVIIKSILFNNKKMDFKLASNSYLEIGENLELVISLMKNLKHRPDLISKILYLIKQEEIRKGLIFSLINFFYEDYFSGAQNIQTNLSLLFYFLLKEDIFMKKAKLFSKYSICHSFCRELIYKNDIEKYLSYIHSQFQFLINELNHEIIFELDIVKEKVNQKILKANSMIISDFSKISKSLEGKRRNSRSDEAKNDFKRKFLITLEYLSKEIDSQKDINMKTYLEEQLCNLQDDILSYADQDLFCTILKQEHAEEIFDYYLNNYIVIKNCIKRIFLLLEENLIIMPINIRYFCKIFSELYSKYSKANGDKYFSVVKRNHFISKFLFRVLFKYYRNNIYLSSVNEDVIRNNYEKIFMALEQLTKGKFYTNKKPDLLSLNGLFIELMPQSLSFFNKLLDIELPEIIQKLINGTIDENRFFYEPKEEAKGILLNDFCCFSVEDIYHILETMYINQSDILTVKENSNSINTKERNDSDSNFIKYYEHSNDSIIKAIQKYHCDADNTGTSSRKNFLITKIKNQKQNNVKIFILFQDQSIFKDNSHYIDDNIKKKKEIKNSQIKISNEQKNLNTAKKYLGLVLSHIPNISTYLYSNECQNNLSIILNKIKIICKGDDIYDKNHLPLEWYMNSLIQIIGHLPRDYMQFNYKKFFTECMLDAKNKITIDSSSENLGNFKENLLKVKKIYELNLKQAENRQLKKVISNFISDKEFLSVFQIWSFIEKDREKTTVEFQIFENNLDNNPKIKKLKKKGKLIFECSSIEDFVVKFPNLAEKYSSKENVLIKLNSDIVQSNLYEYLKIIQGKLQNYYLFFGKEKEEIEIIYLEVNNYLYSKLYPKIFKPVFNDLNLKVHIKCHNLSWIKLQNLVNTNILLDNILNDCLSLVDKFENKAKSPYEKINIILLIGDLINKNLIFESGKDDYSLDQFLPIFEYIFIKAKPKYLRSNITYIETFLEKKYKNGKFAVGLSWLQSILDLLLNITFEKLLNISKEEYEENCKKSFDNYMINNKL